MKYETILYEKEDQIAIITLNRPEQMNALSIKLCEELSAVFTEIANDEEVIAVILTGGPKVFCAGADIKERSQMKFTQPQIYLNLKETHHFFSNIENYEKPVIAAVSGVAVGGGCELALVCDLRIASETAKFGLPEVKIGVIPAAGGTQRLPRIIGITKAKELLFTGETIDAQEAYRLNLVNKVVSEEQLLETAKEMAKKLTAKPPLAIKFGKRAVNAGMQMDLASALDYESYCAALLAVSEDRIEGFKAFTEKRKPHFKGK